ncbi:hypothetical protein ANCDUO_08368 [Ancylostoma duodenale]|uniref:Uncharacterized protein n=1 Tax=Ancylostoma duodenale TaxID=51022 RepID=A0A0C2GQK5_9BILA|nr:hypothetical protein ANCDUO_08368 [Ancylostoma duodenale]
MVRTRKIRYDVIGLTGTRRYRPLNATFDTGEELFLGTCDSRGVGGVGILVNTNLAMNIDSFEQLTTRIGRLRLRRSGSIPALTIFVACAPTSSYDDEEIEAFYMDLEKFYMEDTFYKRIRDAAAYAKLSKIRWAGHVMRFNDNRWTRAVSDRTPRDVKRTTGRPPTRWSDFFTKSFKDRYDAFRVPRTDRTHWTTLARERDK